MTSLVYPPNYRDVGEALGLWLSPSPIPSGRLLRGGKIDHLTTANDIGAPKTIINLRRGPDPSHLLGIRIIHLPASDSIENYDTSQAPVRRWLSQVLETLANPATEWPVYIHCTSGRDRTGVVVATILTLLEVPHEIVVEEYSLSNGADRAAITSAIDRIRNTNTAPLASASLLRAALAPGQ